MTTEAKVLKRLREKSGLSMREAGSKIGISSSMVSQIENGRENVPRPEKLEKFLKVYGVSFKAFYKQVSEFEDQETDEQILHSLVPRLKQNDIKALRVMAEHFLR